jgi:TolB-like protein
VGKNLNLRYVPEGSVLPEGDEIRVTAQLIEAASDAHLWSELCDIRRAERDRRSVGKAVSAAAA